MTPVELDTLGAVFNADVTPCGSRVTCSPPPGNTDADYLVLLNGDLALAKLFDFLVGGGWQWEGATEHYQNVAANAFTSFRKGSDNLIVTTNPDFARRHKVATHICKRLNLMSKPDRIMVFQAVLYGNLECEK